jgi:[ribosomal protein S5]-alanine N-acetyltransferase
MSGPPSRSMRIATPRLELIASTPELLETELASPQHLGVALGAHVPEGWPPGEYDEHAIRWLLDRLSAQPDAAGWFGWYALMTPESGTMPDLVAAGGYTGPPDETGTVEIGYSVVPAFGKRGIATEMVAALVDRAFADVRVTRVIAHTFPANTGSIRVLEKNAFVLEGPGKEAGTVRYVRPRTGA